MVKNSYWTTIRVPKEIASRIRELAEYKGIAMWKILAQLLSFYSSIIKDSRRRDEIPIVDKTSWYIVKLSYSISKFKDNPSDENMKWLIKTVQQIHDRLGVDLTYILRVAEAYRTTRSKEDLIELNMSWKMCIVDLIYNTILKPLGEVEEKTG